MTREHGGDLAQAIARYGGARADWLDLSTGINPVPYPLPDMPETVWTRLPEPGALAALAEAARGAYAASPHAGIVAAPGVSALIQLMPRLTRPGYVAIPRPTYAEHTGAFRAEGWQVIDRPGTSTQAAVIVNPNTPDARRWSIDELMLMAEALPLLVVDETYIETEPERSLAPRAAREGLVVLRSFGAFFGLAGLRLGFAITGPETAKTLAEMLGPWPVSGPAIAAGRRALGDAAWATTARARIAEDAARLVRIGESAGWRLVGQAGLFATFETPDAAAAAARLAEARIWSRRFAYSRNWLRLGLPGGEEGWQRLAAALGS